MATRTKLVHAHGGSSLRGRDAEFSSAPIRVSGEAHIKSSTANRVQQFGFVGQDWNVLPERPSTSGGPSPQSSARKESEKRGTKDDFHFNSLAGHGRVMSSHSSSLPAALPTPAGTPKSSPPLPPKPSFNRTDTPESMVDGRLAGMGIVPAEIGMALGSPSQQPMTWQSPSPFESTARSSSPDEQASSPVPSRQKSRRWKLLGGLFGNKKQTASTPQPFYHLQPDPVQQRVVGEDYDSFGEPPVSSTRKLEKSENRGRANSERQSEKVKPDMRRANTVPTNFDWQDPERERMKVPQVTLDGAPITRNQSINGGLMLDVDIPSIQMERYSVMFGSVLQKPTNTSSSLLARRQATLEKLKTVNETLASKVSHHAIGLFLVTASNGDQQNLELVENPRQRLPRRATSPQPTKSPAFSLFPSTPSQQHGNHVPPSSPAQQLHVHRRANTSPAVPSPSYPSFAPRQDDETHATLLAPATRHISPSHKLKEHISSQMKQPVKDSSKIPTVISPKPQRPERVSSLERSHHATDMVGGRVEDSYNSAPFQIMVKPRESTRQIAPSSSDSVVRPSGTGSAASRSAGYSVSISASGTSTIPAPRSSSTRRNSPMHSPPPTSLFRSHTTSSATRPHPLNTPSAPLGSNPVTGQKINGSEIVDKDIDEREKDLRTAAEISIARQISVSRQQTQLLIPIRSPSSKRVNSPSVLNIGQVASPLGVVAAGIEQSVTGRSGSQKKDAKRTAGERLAAPAAKSSTPTLVVVGGDTTESSWGGAIVPNIPELDGTSGGEVKVRAVAEHRHRKSERVIVENISTTSN
jgi:hypothetical protein